MRGIILTAPLLFLGLPSFALAAPITPFALFGGNHTTLGSNVTVNTGLTGSNNGMSVGSGSDTLTVTGAGVLSGGNNLEIMSTGDIIFNGNVAIGNNTHVTGDIHSGGNVVVGTGTQVDGDIVAAGTVSLDNGSQVGGNVDAGALTGTAITIGNNVDIGGNVTRHAGTNLSLGSNVDIGGTVATGIPATPLAYMVTAIPDATAFSSGGVSHSLANNAVLGLLPGSYGGISLGSNGTLNLSAGRYYFDSWNFGNNTQIVFDVSAGEIQVFLTGNATLGSNVDSVLVGGGAESVYAETLGNWSVGNNSDWTGTLFASGASSSINFGSSTSITGAAWARNQLVVGGNSTVDYVLATYATPTVDVPEPAILGLLGIGLIGMGVGSARRRARVLSRPRA